MSHASTLFNKKRLSEYQSSAAKLLSKANKETDYTSMQGEMKKDDPANDVSSAAKSSQPDVNGFHDVAGYNTVGNRKNEKGQMLDSDGFAMLDLEDMDTNELTLEEKILCGFFSARPCKKEKYASSLLNRPNPPEGEDY